MGDFFPVISKAKSVTFILNATEIVMSTEVILSVLFLCVCVYSSFL